MPELPEVETVRRTLEAALVGRTIVSARVHRRDVVVAPGDPAGGWSRASERPVPVRLTARMLLAGTRVVRLARRGKRLAIIGENARTLEIHLGMTGQVIIAPARTRLAQRDHLHVRWKLDNADRMVFRDPRRFGGIWLHASEQSLVACWNELGPDALSISARELRRRAGASGRAIKAALLDQRVVAGVGNIYADESLFSARLSPHRPARELSPEQWPRLARAVRTVLQRSISARGTTLRDYRDARGERGSGQRGLKVYGQAGRSCPGCGGVLQRTVVAQRTTCWCPNCQE